MAYLLDNVIWMVATLRFRNYHTFYKKERRQLKLFQLMHMQYIKSSTSKIAFTDQI